LRRGGREWAKEGEENKRREKGKGKKERVKGQERKEKYFKF
jgi:hypothetical protein